jgi:hypothetical protein
MPLLCYIKYEIIKEGKEYGEKPTKDRYFNFCQLLLLAELLSYKVKLRAASDFLTSC